MKKIKLYNLTLHPQLNTVEGFEVEEKPRLRAIKNPEDWEEIKQVVREAFKGVPPDSDLLVGGLGQFQALIQQIADHNQMRLWFAIMDPETRKVKGFTRMPWLSRQETILP